MEKLEYIREKLQDRKRHAEVVRRTEISQRTIENIISPLKQDSTPRNSTINAIYSYFVKKDGK